MSGVNKTNEHIFSSFSSCSGFSSSINCLSVETLRSLGYYSADNAIGSFGGTPLSDAFLGYKYGISEYTLDYPWLNLIAEEEYDDNEYYLYENTSALSGAMLIDGDKELELSEDICASTQSLYEYLGGRGAVTTKTDTYTLDKEGVIFESDSMNVEYEINDGGVGIITVNASSSEYSKIIYVSVNVGGNRTIYYEGKTDNFVPMQSSKSLLLNMGYMDSYGEDISSRVVIADKYPIKEVTIYELNYDMVESLLNEVRENSVQCEYTANGFNVKTTASDQKLVVTNINIDGYKITLNGNEVGANGCNFIEINLINGENEVVAKYEYPYSKILVLSIILGVLALAVLIVVYKLSLIHI